MNEFSGFSLTEERVEGLLARAVRREDGKYVSALSEDDPLEGRSEFLISEANWVAVEDFDDVFGSARLLRDKHDDDHDDNVFLRIGGTLTSASRDDNGVSILAPALRSIPQDFQDRTTLLFNHNKDTPIGRIVNTRVIRADGVKPARAVIVADVHRLAVNVATRLTFAELIRSRVLSKYSFAWSVIRGEMIFDLSDKGAIKIDEDEETVTMPFGSDFAPEINVQALRATETSIVSVPALAAADVTVARQFARSLDAVRDNWIETLNGLLIPIESLRATATVNRPFVPAFALSRVRAWAAADGELDLDNDIDFARFAQAFAGHENDGRSVEDWYGLHADVVDGKLVWNKRAVAHCLSELETEQRCADRQRMSRELSIVHGIDIDA